MRTAALFVCALCACASDLAGTWTGQIAGRWGDIEDITFRFTRVGDGCAGKLYTEAESLPVRDCKLEGDRLSFHISTEMNGGGRKFLYTGVIKGSEIELSRRRELLPGDPDPQGTRSTAQKIVVKRLF